MAKHWNASDLPRLDGKIALVTGANSGLGLETAKGLAGAGARVLMACRNTDKGRAAAEAIESEHGDVDVHVLALDLADLTAVHRFADLIAKKHPKIDILVNNAGVMALPLRRTMDGFEMQIGTNHLGHFALTGLLGDALKSNGKARVVTVSSLAHRMGRISLDDLNWERRKYDKWAAYGQSKLANLMFALEFQRRLDNAGIDAISVAAHPGYAATHLQYAGPEMTGSRVGKAMMATANAMIAQSQARGALPSLYAAAVPDVEGGEYLGPAGPMELRGPPGRAKLSKRAQDPETARELWTLSEQLTGVRFGL